MLSEKQVRVRMRMLVDLAAQRDGMGVYAWCEHHKISTSVLYACQSRYKGATTYPTLQTLYKLEEATGYPAWKLLYTQGDENGKQE